MARHNITFQTSPRKMGLKKSNKNVIVKPDQIKKLNIRGASSSNIIMEDNDQTIEEEAMVQQNYFSPLNTNNNDQIIKENTTQAPKKKLHVPPIVVKVSNFYELSQKLNSTGIKLTYKHMSVGTSIVTNNKEDHTIVIEYLKRENIGFFTHDIKSNQPFKVVLRGLQAISENELKDELCNKGLTPLAIFPMKRKIGISGRDQPFLIHFPKADVDLKTLKLRIPNIFYTIIRWEPYINTRDGPTFCNNCLQNGHGTRNCNMAAKCNICGKDHKTALCPISDSAIRKCANCNGNHPASSASCPKRLQYIEIRNNIREKAKHGQKFRGNAHHNKSNINLNDNNMFPNLVNSTNTQTYQNNNNANNNTNESNSLFGPNELLSILDEMLNKLSSCKTKQEQIMILGQICMKHVFGNY